MLNFKILHPRFSEEMLGFLPGFADEDNPETASQQFNQNYAHGGGWSPMTGWQHKGNWELKYPGDPVMKPLALAKLRDETICFYDHAFVAIFQPDGTFEIARMD